MVSNKHGGKKYRLAKWVLESSGAVAYEELTVSLSLCPVGMFGSRGGSKVPLT